MGIEVPMGTTFIHRKSQLMFSRRGDMGTEVPMGTIQPIQTVRTNGATGGKSSRRFVCFMLCLKTANCLFLIVSDSSDLISD